MATRNTVWRWNDMRDQRRNRKAPLEQLKQPWLLAGNYAKKTRKDYEEAFDQFVGWMRAQGCAGVLGELDPLIVRRWQFQLESLDRSVNTIRGYLASLKSFSRYLMEERITLGTDGQPVNLLDGVKVPPLPKSRPQVYKDGEVALVLSSFNPRTATGARNLSIIRLMLDAGLRLKEAVSIKVEDIDWESGAIHVRWQSAKRQKERTTYVGRSTLAFLLLYRDLQRTEFPGHQSFDELFLDWDGGPLTTSAFQCVLKRLKAKLGLKRLSAHQFRRTWATNYRKHQVGDLFSLQQEGGWEDLEVPQRFYVDTSLPRENRASVMDHLELEQRKDNRTRRKAPIQMVEAVQQVQVVETRPKPRLRALKRAK